MTQSKGLQAMASGARQIELQAAGVGLAMLRIPPGEFEIGSPEDEPERLPNEGPIRKIRMSKPFYLGRYQVTQAQFKAVTGINPSSFEGPDLAMDQITFPKAIQFCRQLSRMVGITVTLPTEAQWEYACRAGTKTRYYSGSTLADLDRIAWYASNSGDQVHPVGQKEPNAFGLHDMIGNVWELCADFLPDYNLIANTDPSAVPSPMGAMRGGGWMDEPKYCRSACRLVSDEMFGGTGVRIAVNP